MFSLVTWPVQSRQLSGPHHICTVTRGLHIVSVSRLSSSLVHTRTSWHDLLITIDYDRCFSFFSGISRGPCNNWHYLCHVKHVDDDDDDDDDDNDDDELRTSGLQIIQNGRHLISRVCHSYNNTQLSLRDIDSRITWPSPQTTEKNDVILSV